MIHVRKYLIGLPGVGHFRKWVISFTRSFIQPMISVTVRLEISDFLRGDLKSLCNYEQVSLCYYYDNQFIGPNYNL